MNVMNENYYKLLRQLKSIDEKERRYTLLSLKELEYQEVTQPSDIIEILQQEENDPILLSYAIGAVERMKITEAHSILKTLFLEQTHPILLVELLETFKKLKDPQFIPTVLKRFSNKKKSNISQVFSTEFILDQILLPTLKYFQVVPQKKIKAFALNYLEHKDVKIRSNALKIFDSPHLLLDEAKLQNIASIDPSIIIREQAKIMLQKKHNKI